jgi:FMN phosphatase YigB (HAD superfamily)
MSLGSISSSRVQTWLVDFDETLAVGSLTWVLGYFPKFVHMHQLDADNARLQQVMLVLQERGRQTPDSMSLLKSLFEMMEWPSALQNQLLADLRSQFQPTLFDDALPFLERLHSYNRRVYIISNNKRTPEHVNLLGIGQYVTEVLTPHSCPDTQPKPHPSLWNYLVMRQAEIDPGTTAIIGDDPWSDGGFAESCGLPCWIVDRQKRFSEMFRHKPYQWVQSLLDVPV